jgi:hypothetical protein
MEELEDDLQTRYREIAAAALPDFDARHLEDMVRDMAARLRITRTQRRLHQVAREQAETVRSLRRGPAIADATLDGTETAPDPAEITEQFLETTSRQRELTYQYQQVAGRYPAAAEAEPDRVEEIR